MINLIAAVGKNLELGKNNDLIWHLKEDMKYFKDTTINHTVVMGRKTYESIGKPLPNRKNIVITSKKIYGVETVNDPKEVLNLNTDLFIIGGASIYEYFIDYADTIYLTEIKDSFINADVYFPSFDKTKYKRIVIGEGQEKGVKYSFIKYSKL